MKGFKLGDLPCPNCGEENCLIVSYTEITWGTCSASFMVSSGSDFKSDRHSYDHDGCETQEEDVVCSECAAIFGADPDAFFGKHRKDYFRARQKKLNKTRARAAIQQLARV